MTIARFAPYALTAFGIAEAAVVGRDASGIDQSTTLLLVVLCTLPTALRNTWPIAVTIGVPVFFVIMLSTGVRPPLATIAALLWVCYLAGARYLSEGRRSWPTVTVALLFVLNVVSPFDGAQPANLGSLALLALTASAMVAGDAAGKRHHAVAERDAARRDSQVMAERARIARELHDVVAHHVSMIAVQAETARLTTPGLPDLGRERFAEIGVMARDALTQMRGLLTVLREEAPAESGPAAAVRRVPQPSLDDVEDLVAAANSAGDPVTLTVIGTPRPLPPAIGLAAYRIAQEALTNARRHAPGARTEVTVDYQDEAAVVRVRDHGTGTTAAPAPDGLGLLGMRERASLAGGTLRAETVAGGGFLVEAHLPLADRAHVADRADRSDPTDRDNRPDRSDPTDRPDPDERDNRPDRSDPTNRPDPDKHDDRADPTDGTHGDNRPDATERDRADRDEPSGLADRDGPQDAREAQ